MITSIAFVGLGAMGAPMAENLVRRQFRVTGFDMREAAGEALVAAGGHVADSAKAACAGMHHLARLEPYRLQDLHAKLATS